jgi:ADP-dependent NAD(P)H-hydrate dehydratase
MPKPVTPELLRGWQLPAPGESKDGRGRVLVVGGARATPGAAMIAGIAALRVGAGVLQLAVAESVAVGVAVAVPEAGVISLSETKTGSVGGSAAAQLQNAVAGADAVLVGPGLDDAEETVELLRGLRDIKPSGRRVVLDAYALGALPGLVEMQQWPGVLTLTPNRDEAARLLATGTDDLSDDDAEVAAEISGQYDAAVSYQSQVVSDGQRWVVPFGHPGLGTSGSGDVLAGAIAGLLARGVEPGQATCWATYLHAAAGDRLAAQVGRVGFLARELLDQLPRVLTELST